VDTFSAGPHRPSRTALLGSGSVVHVALRKSVLPLLAIFTLFTTCREEAPEAARSTSSPPTAPDCPADPLEPGPAAKQEAIAAVGRSLQAGKQPERDYQIEKAYPAMRGGFGAIALHLCGRTVGARTWVVEVRFPKLEPSASLSQGQAFVSRFRSGWKVWYRYH